jgi:DNA-directed RNA polymerase subunit M/transcription elongation factor TFIIS
MASARVRWNVLHELRASISDLGLATEVEYVLMHLHCSPTVCRGDAGMRYRAYAHRILNMLRQGSAVREELLERLRDDVPTSVFAAIGTQDVASDKVSDVAKCEERLALLKDLGSEVSLPNAGTRCARCSSTDIKFNMLQMRSADEPMSIFCSCRGCGKRWRM